MVQPHFYCIVILLSSSLNLLKEYVTCCFSSHGLHLIAAVVKQTVSVCSVLS